MADDVKVEIKGNATGVNKAFKEAEAGSDRLGVKLKQTSQANTSFTATGQKAAGAATGIGAAATKASGGIGILGVALGQIVASAAIGAITTGLRALGETMVGYNARMEQARIGFTSLLGSADAAAVFVGQLQDFAAKTPFEFPQLQDAAKKFLAFGFAAKDVIPSLTAVGDAVAALGGGTEVVDRVVMALGQIKSKGRVQGEELLQLAEAGIPAYQILADKLKLTGQEVANIGEKGISAEIAIKALTEGMNERFGGMMAAQSQSFTGLMSTLKDNASMLAGFLGEDLFAGMKSGLTQVTTLTSSLADAVRTSGWQGLFRTETIDNTTRSIHQLNAGLGETTSSLRGMKETPVIPPEWHLMIKTVWNAFSNFGETVYTVSAKIMASVQDAFGKGGDAAIKWLPILERVASALVTLIGTAVEIVVMWIGVFADTASEAANFVVSAWDTLGKWFQSFADSVAEIFSWLQSNVIGPVAEAFGSTAESVAGIWQDLRNWIVEKTSSMVKGILEALGPLGKALGIAFAGLGDAFNSLAGTKNDTFGKWAAKTKQSTTNAAKGFTDLGNHMGRSMEMGADKGGKASEKMENDAKRVSEAIEREWAKQTETKLQLNDRWLAENLESLEKTKAANENYERDKQRVFEVYASRKSDLLNKQAKEERDLKEATVKAMAEIESKTRDGYLGQSTGSEGKVKEIEAEQEARLRMVDNTVKAWKEGNVKLKDDYGNTIESQLQMDAWAEARRNEITAGGIAARKAYLESAQAVEDGLKKARDANDLAAYAQKLSDENAMKLAQYQEQQTMMDMLYKWQLEAHQTMTTFMLQQADQIKNSLAAGIAQSIVYGKNLGEILGNIGKQVAAAFIEMMVKQALAAALGQSLQKMMMASTMASAAAIAAAWAPAAFLAAVATQGSALAFGGMAIAGAAGSAALLGGLTAGIGAAGGAPAGLPSAMTRATGGLVEGPGTATSDSILTRLSNGEFVIKTAAVNKFGVGFFEALNAGKMPSIAAVVPAAVMAAGATIGTAADIGLELISNSIAASSLMTTSEGMYSFTGISGPQETASAAIPNISSALQFAAASGITTGAAIATIGNERYQDAIIPHDNDTMSGLGLGGGPVQVTQNNYGDINTEADYDRLFRDLGNEISNAMMGA